MTTPALLLAIAIAALIKAAMANDLLPGIASLLLGFIALGVMTARAAG